MKPNVWQCSEKQAEFISSQGKLTAFVGGVGSGKTHAGALWAMTMMAKYPHVRGLICANTYRQLHHTTLLKLMDLLTKAGVGFVHGSQPPWFLSPFPDHSCILSVETGTQLFTYSLDNYDPMRGIEVGWAWLDETRDTKEEAATIVLERLRGYGNNFLYQLKLTSTPNSFDWMYDWFANPDTKMPDSKLVHATTMDNPFVPPDYGTFLLRSFSKTLGEQQVLAKFVNLFAGQAYEFDRNRHVRPAPLRQDLPLIFSLDFNVSPLCGVVMQIDVRGRRAWVLDEIHIPDNAQTRVACQEFVRRWKGKHSRYMLDGDCAGAHRDTRGMLSDHDIMRNEITPKTLARDRSADPRPVGRWVDDEPLPIVEYGWDYVPREQHDGILAVNALLNPGGGDEPRLFIDPKCKFLMRDLEVVCFQPGTRNLDKKSSAATHVSDALRYPIQRLLPLKNMTYTPAPLKMNAVF